MKNIKDLDKIINNLRCPKCSKVIDALDIKDYICKGCNRSFKIKFTFKKDDKKRRKKTNR